MMRILTLMGLTLILCVPVSQAVAPASGKSRRPKLKKVAYREFGAAIFSLDLASGSDLAVVALSDGRVRVWRLDTNKIVKELNFGHCKMNAIAWKNDWLSSCQEPLRARFSPDGRMLAVSFLNRIYLYHVDTWNLISSLGLSAEEHTQGKQSLESPEGCKDRDLDSGGEKVDYDGWTRVTDFAFTSDSRSLVSSSARCKARFIDGGVLFAYPSGSDPIRRWSIATAEIEWESHPDPVHVVARLFVSPNGRVVAATTGMWEAEHRIFVHDMNTGENLYTFSDFTFLSVGAPTVTFTPDGGRFLSVSTDSELERRKTLIGQSALYESLTGTKIQELESPSGAVYAVLSSDGRWLATANSKHSGFQIWDFRAKKAILDINPRKNFWKRWAPSPSILQFDPDGRWLVVAIEYAGFMAVYEVRIEK